MYLFHTAPVFLASCLSRLRIYAGRLDSGLDATACCDQNLVKATFTNLFRHVDDESSMQVDTCNLTKMFTVYCTSLIVACSEPSNNPFH